MTEAIILAGGKGTRIRPLTYTRPKPLLPVANRTLLDRVLASIPKSFDTILLPVNYLADHIRKHLEEHPDPRVVLVDEPEPMGSGGAIKNCERHLTGSFLVLNADIVSTLDVAGFWAQHVKRQARVTLSLWPVAEPWHFGVARLGPDDRILEFVEKPPEGTEPSNLANAGHYGLSLDVLDAIPAGRPSILERETFTSLVGQGAPVYGHRFPGFWIDCGRPEAYLEAHRLLLEREGRPHAIGWGVRGVSVARFLSYAVGDDVQLGPGSRVERSVLFPGVEVEPGAVIRDSILGERVRIGRGAQVVGCVVADDVEVEPGRQLHYQRVERPPLPATVPPFPPVPQSALAAGPTRFSPASLSAGP